MIHNTIIPFHFFITGNIVSPFCFPLPVCTSHILLLYLYNTYTSWQRRILKERREPVMPYGKGGKSGGGAKGGGAKSGGSGGKGGYKGGARSGRGR